MVPPVPPPGPPAAVLVALSGPDALEAAVRTATGPPGLLLAFAYSFLAAFALPGVSEVVLFAPPELGLPAPARLAVVVLVSSVGKAAESVLALRLGRGARESGPVVRLLERSPFDVVARSERRTVELARRYGYAGLALALSVPGFPDTLSLYAFAVLDDDYRRFAAAAFLGSVGRLLVTLAALRGVALAA